ncbi:anti-sigma factor family protein [Cnuibacter sp. UC19_7]|uniref:anti-sigma factor family protein n=1 Tax=Cnuibacter sp. UC19_7 TaxID=3350166 RepID=UPI00367004EF
MTDDYREWDAAYVLGALAPEERREYERHLETCAECRSRLAELAGIPGILGAVTPEEAVALSADEEPEAHEEAPASLVRSLATSMRVRRRRLRRRVVAGAAAAGLALAALGVGGGILLAPTISWEPGATTYAMESTVPDSVEARIAVTAKSWGTRFDWNCSYGDWADQGLSADYDLVVTDVDGRDTVVATWTAAGAKTGNLTASTSIPVDRIRSVEIRFPDSDQALAQADLGA